MRRSGVILAFALAVSGCNSERKSEPPPIRPVLSMVVTPQTTRRLGFAGTVEPRYQASLGFRVLGRIISREVNVGDVVRRDQILASLDPLALELAVRAAQADVASASAQVANTSSTEARQRTLLEQNVATPAVYEAAQQAQAAAAAALTRAQANLAKAQEQLGYAQLRSDFDGVVTRVDAEVGQVVSPGQAVATVARPDIREAVVDVPETVAAGLQPGTTFHVGLQLDPGQQTTGTVREIAPQADATTRTRRVRITLKKPPDSFRLGTIINAVLTTETAPQIELPASALLTREGKRLVWVVDPASATVQPREVQVADADESSVRIAGGLEPGTRVVTAGANSLSAGQAVKILDEAPR